MILGWHPTWPGLVLDALRLVSGCSCPRATRLWGQRSACSFLLTSSPSMFTRMFMDVSVEVGGHRPRFLQDSRFPEELITQGSDL